MWWEVAIRHIGRRLSSTETRVCRGFCRGRYRYESQLVFEWPCRPRRRYAKYNWRPREVRLCHLFEQDTIWWFRWVYPWKDEYEEIFACLCEPLCVSLHIRTKSCRMEWDGVVKAKLPLVKAELPSNICLAYLLGPPFWPGPDRHICFYMAWQKSVSPDSAKTNRNCGWRPWTTKMDTWFEYKWGWRIPPKKRMRRNTTTNP